MRGPIALRARWRAFTREADGSRNASAELWASIRARRSPGMPGGAVPRLAWPATGRLTSPFGMRHGRMHEGIDVAVRVGTPVRSAADGVVLIAGELGVYGNLVVVDHGAAIATVYGHLDRIDVEEGEAVAREQPLGTVGMTGRSFGPHLHFEVRLDGTAVEPHVFLDPAD